jgi:hypothetical protein
MKNKFHIQYIVFSSFFCLCTQHILCFLLANEVSFLFFFFFLFYQKFTVIVLNKIRGGDGGGVYER